MSGYLCDGCNVRDGHMHRCCKDDGAWMGLPPCTCEECKPPTEEQLAAFRASIGLGR